MRRRAILLLPLLSLAACAPDVAGTNNAVDINLAAVRAQDAVDAYGANTADDAPVEIAEPDAARDAEAADNTPTPLDPPAPGTPGGLPDNRTPLSEAPFAPDSAQGAAAVVQTYYALLGEQKYDEAFALTEKGGEEKPPSPGAVKAFAAGFARYSEYHANVGAPGEIDAGAGQRYVTVPVQVYARLKQGGTPVYQLGSVVLHRTGDIDGATVQQRAWHIRSIDLKATPKR